MVRRVIGLTGGIATGKSSVSAYLEKTYQLPILDADLYAREAVQPGSGILMEIAQRYGPKMLLDDGTLDRKQLGTIIFNDAAERAWLESQIHPYVRERILTAERQTSTSTMVAVVPLLFEAKMTELVTEIWVVVCTHAQQCQRLMARDNMSRLQAEARIASQMPLSEKASQATVIIHNDFDFTHLHTQVDQAIR